MPKIWDDSVATHKQRVRATIIDAAVELVGERGRQDLTMSAIAERAGIGRATIYNYFPDVDHILGAYVVAAFDEHQAMLDAQLADVDDPLARLKLSLGLTIDYFASPEHHRGSAVGLENFAPEVQQQVEAATQGLQDHLARLLAEAADRGLIRTDVDPSIAAEALNHMLGVARSAVMHHGLSPAETTDMVFRLFVEGAGTPRARRRSGSRT